MDFSQRLQKRHLTDLIAYMKTCKNQIQALEEKNPNEELGMKEFMQSCLFIGAMPKEVI